MSKVKQHVTEEIIQKFLEGKSKDKSTVVVKESDAYYKENDNKCFKTGLE